VSQSQIGSLVSYTINYMEKKSHKAYQSSQRDADHLANQEIGEDSDDHSLLAEKEDSHSDIDTIEEEVDISQSEGSDHEHAQPALLAKSENENEQE
jgi:hypothetical protein